MARGGPGGGEENFPQAGRKSHPEPFHAHPTDNITISRRQITTGWQCVVTTSAATSFDEQTLPEVTPAGLEAGVNTSMELPRYSPTNVITSKAELERIENSTRLPPKPPSRTYRFLRWNFFSVYRKMFASVLIINLIALIVFLAQLTNDASVATYENAATAASANFCLSILMRNEHVVNLLFTVVCCLPVWTPLAIRRRAAKVYSYGGVHSGCGVSGVIWYITFAVLAVTQYPSDGIIETFLAITTGITLMLLLIILVFAYPTIRTRLHNHFEATHRYGGWCAISVLWVQTMLLVISNAEARQMRFEIALIHSPSFWFLVVITGLLIYPWARLRRREVQVEKISKHATRLHFKYAEMETCSVVRLTDAPLRETHGFATIPNYKDEEKGFTVLVSNAGDWTNKIITNAPERLWVKGAPTLGVMRVALMFKKVLIVATGSGIGPCLSLLQAYPDYPVRVLWSAQDPKRTYGDTIIRSVFRADPNAVVIDTKRTGRPELLALAYALFVEAECEAAVVISNPVVTRKVVYGLETRGVPAYGPIFDS